MSAANRNPSKLPGPSAHWSGSPSTGNPTEPRAAGAGFCRSGCQIRPAATMAVQLVGPKVRIRFPPAKSQRTFSPSNRRGCPLGERLPPNPLHRSASTQVAHRGRKTDSNSRFRKAGEALPPERGPPEMLDPRRIQFCRQYQQAPSPQGGGMRVATSSRGSDHSARSAAPAM